VFVVRGAVDWRDTATLAAGAMLGGYFGGALGRRLPPRVAEILVIVVGLAAAGAQLFR
jgi:uncharacterized membrane protein YfcA